MESFVNADDVKNYDLLSIANLQLKKNRKENCANSQFVDFFN